MFFLCNLVQIAYTYAIIMIVNIDTLHNNNVDTILSSYMQNWISCQLAHITELQDKD
jgi:hypothetical protein